MKSVILDNENATVWVYPTKKMIHHKFKKFTYGDAFKDIFLKATEEFEKNKCTKWLSDDRENGALRPVDRDWAFEVWEPKTIKAGWKHWAIILPKMIAGQMNIKKISERYNQMGINIQVFNDEESAINWLENQN